MKALLILLYLLFICLSLFIFALSNIVAFTYLLLLIVSMTLLWLLYWIRYKNSKILQKTLLFLMGLTLLYTTSNLYIMQKGIYLDEEEILRINGHIMPDQEKQEFLALLHTLKTQQTYVTNKPSYSISFSQEGGLDLEGFHIDKIAQKKLEVLYRKYR